LKKCWQSQKYDALGLGVMPDLLLSACCKLTGKYRPPLALLLNSSLFLPRECERSLKDKAIDVMALLEVRLPLHQLFLIKEGLDIRDLNVGKLWVQIFLVNLLVKKKSLHVAPFI